MVGAPISSYVEPLDYSPCLECKLCVAACPEVLKLHGGWRRLYLRLCGILIEMAHAFF
jgi:ferredoxin